MIHTVPSADWLSKLADIIERTDDGDTVIVASEAARKLAVRAKLRMCPDKTLTFEVKETEPEL